LRRGGFPRPGQKPAAGRDVWAGSVMMTTYVDPAVRDLVLLISDTERRSVSGILREALERWLADEGHAIPVSTAWEAARDERHEQEGAVVP
jgi:hypothetical protein